MAKKKSKSSEPEKRTCPVPWAKWWPIGCPMPGTTAFENLPWPGNVPVLTAKDIAKTHEIPLTKPPFNLDGWYDSIFVNPAKADPDVGNVNAVAGEALAACIRKHCPEGAALWEFQSCEGITPQIVADVWNEAMELLDYDMSKPTPPAAPAKKSEKSKKPGKEKPATKTAEPVDDDYLKYLE